MDWHSLGIAERADISCQQSVSSTSALYLQLTGIYRVAVGRTHYHASSLIEVLMLVAFVSDVQTELGRFIHPIQPVCSRDCRYVAQSQ